MAETLEKTDTLTKYRKPGQQPAAVAKQDGVPRTKQTYEPYHLSSSTHRHLELRLKFPDPAECPLNSMITHFRIEWRRGLSVSILYGKTMQVIIKGKNLQELAKQLKEAKVEWIEEFDDRFHLPVDGKTAPIIKSIEIITQNTEMPPPPNQRH